MRAGFVVLLVSLAIVGCRRPSERAGHRALVTSASGARSSSPSPPIARSPLPDGCYNGLPDELPGERGLEQLVRQCIAGMHPVWPAPKQVALAAGQPNETPFTIADPTRCVRAAVVANGVEEVGAAIVDAHGAELARSDLEAPFALVERTGSLCVPSAGIYKLRLSAPRGTTTAFAQVFVAD